MASKMIGRTGCPECGFGAAHVKESEAKPGKVRGCVYRWCPECGAQYYTRTETQAARLLDKTRAEAGAQQRRAADAEPAAAPVDEPAETLGDMPHPAAAPRRGIIGWLDA